MKKIIILLALFSCTVFYGQAEFDAGVQITGGQPTVTTSTHITTTEANGVQGKILGENISIDVTPPVSNYVPLAPNIKGHLQGIDFAIGNFVTTTAGITNRIYFTADPVTLPTGTYYLTNGTGKGTATSAIQGVTNDDNVKQYFAQDLISIAQPLNLTVPSGSFSGQLTTMIDADPSAQQQRYTVELYLCDTNGTPLNSGIPGAPVGGLGVTVVAILDSGLINLVAGNLTNINITGNVTAPLSVTAGQRFRYHVSAEKVGTGGSSIVMQIMYGNLYNSYYDVPVTFDTNSVLNRSTVTGTTTTNALDYLNVNKANDIDVVHKTGTETIPGNKTFAGSQTGIGSPGSYIIGHPSDSFNAGTSIKGGLRVENTTGEALIVNTTAYGGGSHLYDANVLAIQNKSTYLGVLSEVPSAIRFLSNTDGEMGAIGYQNGAVGTAFANSVFLAASLPYYPSYPLVAPTRLALIQEGDYLGVLVKKERLEFNSDWSTRFKTPDGTTRLMMPVSGRVLINTTTDNAIDQLQVNGSISATALKIPTLTSNLVLKSTTGGQIANSTITDNGTNIGIGNNSTAPSENLEVRTTGNAGFAMTRNATSNLSRFYFKTGTTYNWSVGVRNTRNDYSVYNESIPSEAFTINYSTNNALIGTTTDNATDKLQVNGSILGTSLKLSTAPTTSAGTYDILTRNTSTGVVEKVTTANFVTDAIIDAVTTIAPSQNSVFDALVLKSNLNGAVFTGLVEVPNLKTSGNIELHSTNKGFYAPNDGGITFYTSGAVTPGWTANTNITATFYKTNVYTVATLPTTGVVSGTYATVSDALAPSYLVTIVGGGSIVTPVFYNGSVWVAH